MYQGNGVFLSNVLPILKFGDPDIVLRYLTQNTEVYSRVS